MSNKKWTPWFPGDVNPVRVGVYQRKRPNGNGIFSRWDGIRWMVSSIYADVAEKERCHSLVPYVEWRGLAKEPKVKK